ncbi:transcription factor PAP1-domain-containing protein [Peziza echinospora]|nr:transcription factor PAP1-domain-containing protein [Peziza echinospora]
MSPNPHLYLDSVQQDLLLAALASNSSPMFLQDTAHAQSPFRQSLDNQNHATGQKNNNQLTPASGSHHQSPTNINMNMTPSSTSMGFATPLNDISSISPVVDDLDYSFDIDGSYDYDFGMGEDYGTYDENQESPVVGENEKRKSPPTDSEDGSPSADPHDTEPKRRDTEDKVAKKPGRKPLTSEPTSKRKAQNRAAQRAFRERKEKHLKDLEQKVTDLEKASEVTNKENSALRQQISRLQVELNEYRKRINDSKSNFSTLLGKGSSGGFQFEFPRFGGNPPTTMSNTKSRQSENSGNQDGLVPGAQASRARSSTTPSSYSDSNNQRDSPMSHRLDSTNSPSSSVSIHGTSSSVTSPESNSHSPLTYKDQLEPVTEEIVQVMSSEHDEPGFSCGVLDDGETSFCEKLGAIACGNPRNPAPLSPDSKLLPNLNKVIPRPDPATIARRNSENFSTMAAMNGGQFDPVLFGDYRDPMDPIHADLNMSFFDDAFPMPDFSIASPIMPSTPLGGHIEPEHKKPVPPGLKEMDDDYSSSDDEDLMVTAQADANLMSCNKIWDRISAHPKFVSGELDMDHLCSELRSKAKCSETGVVVGQKDVEAVLSKAGLKDSTITGSL